MGKQCAIYKIENKVNGKVYVGQTTIGFENRITRHLYELKKNIHKNTHLQNAWKRNGEDNFEFHLITECELSELDDLERTWIEIYNSTDRRYGYNLESGGNKHKTHCKETKSKLSKMSKKRWNDPKYATRMRKILTKTHSGANNVNAKKVICINTGEVFETLTEASKKYNLSSNDIHKVCVGERNSAGFFTNGKPLQFAYYEEGKTYKLKELKNLRAKRRIICTNTKEVFETSHEASKKYGLSQGSIISCCTGKIKSAGKLPNGEYSVWVYEEDYEPNRDYHFHRHMGTHNPRAKQVICLTTGEVFETMKEAGLKYNISGNGCKISLACTGKRKYVGSLPDGTKLRWAYVES